jgi:N-acetylglucosaminyl-diphospho-decaprenol L-rhamnosyltransferase
LNLIRGASQSSVLPSEAIVVFMNQSHEPLLEAPFPIKPIHIDSDHMPLARSRNVCAQNASNEIVIFLDVDCIPSSRMFEKLLSSTEINRDLVMATPRYLKNVELQSIDDTALSNQSIGHDGRKNIKHGHQSDYTVFWSLCFTLSKTTFNKIGGFDERFIGYGGEDTDFALSAQKAGVDLTVSDAECFHQYHPVYKPPVQHVKDIVINSNYFYSKWKTWPMTGWLERFAKLQYIQWHHGSNSPIEILRLPDHEEVEKYRDDINPY